MTKLEELKPCKCNDPDSIHEKDYCGFKMIECEECDVTIFEATWDAAYSAWNRRLEQEG